MADLAFIFHWGRAEIDALSLEDLMHWHALALDVWARAHKKE